MRYVTAYGPIDQLWHEWWFFALLTLIVGGMLWVALAPSRPAMPDEEAPAGGLASRYRDFPQRLFLLCMVFVFGSAGYSAVSEKFYWYRLAQQSLADGSCTTVAGKVTEYRSAAVSGVKSHVSFLLNGERFSLHSNFAGLAASRGAEIADGAQLRICHTPNAGILQIDVAR